MSDLDRSGQGWRLSPTDYAAGRDAPFTLPERPVSLYLRMADGCRIALDVWLPQPGASGGPAAAAPAILLLTPYYRRFRVVPGGTTDPIPNAGQFVRYLVPRGYPVVVADVRGTGASFGTRDSFRSPKERADSAAIADWVAAQPWCNGLIGATGISYVGAASDFLASTGHPAVKAIAPLFAVWDTYADNYYPGGVTLTALPRAYGDLALAMDGDRRDLLKAYSYYASPELAGPCPVDEDGDGSLLAAALKEHRGNFRQQDFMAEFRFREKPLPYDAEVSSATFSPYHYRHGIGSDVAVLSVSGWMDGAGYANGAISRFLTLRGNPVHLVLGPWDHGARIGVSPWRDQVLPRFGMLPALLRFFDEYLLGRDTGLRTEAPVHYFSIHGEAWRDVPTWPPIASTWCGHLGPGGTLDAAPGPAGETEVAVDFGFGTGSHTRYERIGGIAVTEYYPDWTDTQAALPHWDTPALPEATELSGHATVVLRLRSSEPDAALHLYLSEVEADGRVHHVTEGLLRALHRKEGTAPDAYRTSWVFRSFHEADAAPLVPGQAETIRVPLLPVSWTFAAGSRIRLSLAGADADHASQVPHGRPPHLTVLHGSVEGSTVELPLRPWRQA